MIIVSRGLGFGVVGFRKIDGETKWMDRRNRRRNFHTMHGLGERGMLLRTSVEI